MTRSPTDAGKTGTLHILSPHGGATAKPQADSPRDSGAPGDAAPDVSAAPVAAPGPGPVRAIPADAAPVPAAATPPVAASAAIPVTPQTPAAAAVARRLTGSTVSRLTQRSTVTPARPPGQSPAQSPARPGTAAAPASPPPTPPAQPPAPAASPAPGMATAAARPPATAAPLPLRVPAPGAVPPASKAAPVLRPPVPSGAPSRPGVASAGAATRPVAGPAELRPRHRGILASFVALVVLPVVATASYLWVVAVDQYASTVGFSVRTEEVSSSLGLLGGITRLTGGSGSSDADILYDYIHSQELVAQLDGEIDLRGMFSVAWPKDPVFAFDPEGSIEDLVDHWENKVRITYDTATGLMTLRVLAFSAEAATQTATRILENSTRKINELSQDAREDATRYARDEMERALERLKEAREGLTGFRMRTRVVDPLADLQGQMGILNSLQSQLAQSYVELDLLLAGSSSRTDPRITQIEQRIAVIQNRMLEERQKFGEGGQGPGGEDFASMVAEFERLTVDLEFAEQAYRVALAAYDAALAEAQRKSRYLAAHIQPTTAERAEYPARWTLLGLTGFFALMVWSIGVLVYYSIRDRR